jgi:hypothetical protein
MIDLRVAIPREDREGWSERFTETILYQCNSHLLPALLDFSWPFRGTYDPRSIAGLLHAKGVRYCRWLDTIDTHFDLVTNKDRQ